MRFGACKGEGARSGDGERLGARVVEASASTLDPDAVELDDALEGGVSILVAVS